MNKLHNEIESTNNYVLRKLNVLRLIHIIYIYSRLKYFIHECCVCRARTLGHATIVCQRISLVTLARDQDNVMQVTRLQWCRDKYLCHGSDSFTLVRMTRIVSTHRLVYIGAMTRILCHG